MQYDLKPATLDHVNMYLHSAFSPDGTLLAVTGWADDHQTYVPIEPGSKEYRVEEMTGPERKSHVFVWDVRTGSQQAHWEADPIEKAVLAPDGMTLATAHNYRVCLRDLLTGLVQKTFLENLSLKYSPGFWEFAFSSNGCRLAVTLEGSDNPGGAYALDLVADSAVMPLYTTDEGEPFDFRSVLHCRFLSGDRLLVGTGYTYDAEDYVYLWDVTTGKKLLTFRGDDPKYEGEAGQPIILSPDGTLLVLVPEDLIGTASVWKLTEQEGAYFWQEQGTFGGDLHATCLGKFSPSGRLFAAPETEGADFNGDVPAASTMTLWEMPSGKERVSFTVPGRCYCWAFAPNGETFAALSGMPEGNYWGDVPEYLLHLWDTETGAERAVLRTENRKTNLLSHEPRNARFSPDGFHLVVSHLRHVELWDLTSILDADGR